MFKKTFLLLVLTSSLYCFTDDDFDGVENKNDKCQNTSILDTVAIDGCPNDRLYIGLISLEYEYLIQNSSFDRLYNSSVYFNIDYKKYLFSYSKSIYKVQNKTYTGDEYFSIGYSFYSDIFPNKTYIGIKKANINSIVSSRVDDYFINTSFNYNYKNNININLFSQYTFVQNNKDTNYNDYLNYSISSSYYLNSFEYSLSYLNSGSTKSYINEYENIQVSFLYNISNSFYIKMNYDKSIINSDNSIAFSLGYNYE